MKKELIVDSAMKTLVFATMVWIVTTAGALLLGDRGTVRVGAAVSLPEGRYTAVDVDNYKGSYLDSLSLMLPASTNIRAIISSYPISVSWRAETTGTDFHRVAVFSRFQPRSRCRILIPRDSEISDVDFKVVNADELDLTVYYGDVVLSFTRRVVKFWAVPVAFTAVFYFLFTLWIGNRFSEVRSNLEKQMDEIKAQQQEAEKKLSEAKREASTIRRQFTYHKVFLMKRVMDLGTELEFWRGTIRKMLYERGKNLKDADKVVELVTESLRTYAASKNIEQYDFKVMMLLADAVSKKEGDDI